MKIVALPFAGGNAWSYRPLEALLPMSAVDYPGHGRRIREPLAGSLDALVADVVQQLASSNEPFVLLGHSLGAQVAAYAASPLLASGAPIRGLVVSGTVPVWARDDDDDPIHELDDDAFLERVREHQWNTDALDHPELRELAMPILRADYAACVPRKTPAPPVSLPTLALFGEDDEGVDQIEEWAALTTGVFEHATFPGAHFFLLADSTRDVVAARVRAFLRSEF